MLARLFNPTAAEASVTVKCPALDLCETLTLGVYEAATYRVRDGKLITGTSAGCAIPFGLKLIEALKGTEEAERIAKQIVIR